MQCTQCGREFRGSDETQTWREENISENGIKASTHYVTRPMSLCPQCASSRRGTERFFLWALMAIVFAFAVWIGIAAFQPATH
jgi:hypothetical protein